MRKRIGTSPDKLLKRLRKIDRTLAVTISRDGQYVGQFGHRTVYPIAGATVRVEQSQPHVSGAWVAAIGVAAAIAKRIDTHLVFEGPGWSLVVRVPGSGKPVHEFASAFNTYAASLARTSEYQGFTVMNSGTYPGAPSAALEVPWDTQPPQG